MKHILYQNGKFEDINDPFKDAENKMETHDEWLKRLGFECSGIDDIGDDEDPGWGVRVHHSSEPGSEFAALVSINDGEYFDNILVKSRSDLLELRLRLQVLRRDAEFRVLKQFSSMARKVFHAWHSHYPEDVCNECDPYEKRRQHEWANRRERERAQARVQAGELRSNGGKE